MSKRRSKSRSKKPLPSTDFNVVPVELPIRFFFPDSHVPVPANQAAIHATGTQVVLTFFHAVPPVFGGSQEHVSKQFSELDHIDARAVSEVSMHPLEFLKFANIVQQHAATIMGNAQERLNEMAQNIRDIDGKAK